MTLQRNAFRHRPARAREWKPRSPLRQISAKRRAALAAQGIANPSSTLIPAQRSVSKRPAGTGPDQNTVNAVLERDGRSCVVCNGALHGIRGVDWSIHHRKLRSQGGDNSLSNTISVCGHGTAGCHGKIHANPKWAHDNGYIVKRDEDPALKSMVHALHGWVFLTADGGWTTRRPAVGV